MKFRGALAQLPTEGGVVVGKDLRLSEREQISIRVKVTPQQNGTTIYRVSYYSWGQSNGSDHSTWDVGYVANLLRSAGYRMSGLEWSVESVAPQRRDQ